MRAAPPRQSEDYNSACTVTPGWLPSDGFRCNHRCHHEYASGDARRALSILERLSQGMTDTRLSRSMRRYSTRSPPRCGWRRSPQCDLGFIKSMRGSDPDAALYWLARMLEGERSKIYCPSHGHLCIRGHRQRRCRALPLATSTLQATQTIGIRVRSFWDSVAHFLQAHQIRASYLGSTRPSHLFKNRHQPVPMHIGNPPVGYEYPHDFPNFITGQSHWPETMSAQQFYNPTDHGDEKVIRARLHWWAQQLKARSTK